MRNTITTGISLFAGLLLIAGCGGQTDQAAQDTADAGTNAPTSTSNASGVDLPERTAPAKSLKLDTPCSIITQQQQSELGANQPPEARTSNGKQGCDYQKGGAGEHDGWFVFVASDPDRTAEEFVSRRPGGKTTAIAGYPAYELDKFPNCQIVVDVSDSGSLFLNGGSRPQENRPDPCPIFTKFAEAAVKNLKSA